MCLGGRAGKIWKWKDSWMKCMTHHWDIFLLRITLFRLLGLLSGDFLPFAVLQGRCALVCPGVLWCALDRLDGFLGRQAVDWFATRDWLLVYSRLVFNHVMLLNHLHWTVAERILEAFGFWRGDWWRFCCRNLFLLRRCFAWLYRLLDSLFHDGCLRLQALNCRLNYCLQKMKNVSNFKLIMFHGNLCN